uniref:Uncharacterized protein n=1 Tax=Vespula pensylvanica TaxID=30213 RepID=A0A834NQ95_VESPE|nr:hypothetical protein H0235_012100 [Vespula pensylvanica]
MKEKDYVWGHVCVGSEGCCAPDKRKFGIQSTFVAGSSAFGLPLCLWLLRRWSLLTVVPVNGTLQFSVAPTLKTRKLFRTSAGVSGPVAVARTRRRRCPLAAALLAD